MDPITASVLIMLGIPSMVFGGFVISRRNRQKIALIDLELKKSLSDIEGQKIRLAILQEENKKYDRLLTGAFEPEKEN